MTWPMEAAYAAAAELLRQGWEALSRTGPERVPLRLRGEAGLLLSALARSAGAQGEALAQALAGGLALEGTPFDRVEARDGLLLLRFSQRWMEQALRFYDRFPWPEPVRATGLQRQDRGDPAFWKDYTLCRCQALAKRTGQPEPEPLPGGLVCLLAQGPGAHPDRWSAEVVRRYWALPPALRRDPLLAGAVGRAVGTF